ncbi:S4 domain-containing protein YaaA [Effusibacillus dendaii]|uniref:S4 domain protein YaaA n=1 Tax=Effusibacillus dendaii TaxID=2743772 RepID=A0A7I8DET7_9BACL|nr:S4 domain-containing protein YaaA [Effusibacillus dendaii]BCJ87469.1 S4 domain protein YaaA [Effusibacillus dendaii]
MRQVSIYSDEITLGQLLKHADIIGSGGEVKAFLQETKILVNGQPENRRGRKLREGDIVEVEGNGRLVLTRSH